jgi:alpha-L-fucosidase 2
MLFQYARYLMIGSSRIGGLPANLQGLWNNSNNPPWRADFHSDVNIEMNYWFVDMDNLSDCFLPFPAWLKSTNPIRTAETHKAFKARGWLTHGENGPFGGSTWQWSKGDSAWMMQNLWDHYQFTLDKDYLEKYAYPLMKGVCEFWQDNLKKLPNGKLVSPNGYSPEHGPHEDGVSFDQQLVWNIFDDFITASKVLGKDEKFREEIAEMQKHLLGPQIGKWGQLQEWMVDRDSKTDRHRHLSHMIAIHPGHQISPHTTPELAKAARVSMNARGDGSTGWSKAWKINIWARLQDGDRAYKLLNEFISHNVFYNLFGYHPPFQIDCNFGYASGVSEMLLQSHMGYIELLPALPDAWEQGYIRGIKARGAFVLDIEWSGGELVKADILSQKGGVCRIYSSEPFVIKRGRRKVKCKRDGKVISFKTKAGKSYSVIPVKKR